MVDLLSSRQGEVTLSRGKTNNQGSKQNVGPAQLSVRFMEDRQVPSTETSGQWLSEASYWILACGESCGFAFPSMVNLRSCVPFLFTEIPFGSLLAMVLRLLRWS